MNILVLDLAFEPKVAIIINKKQKDLIKSESGRNSDTFMKMINQILTNNKLTIKDISAFAINIGPGSFTGLRVAISIAKGLGFDSDVKFFTFNSFDYVDDESSSILVSGFSNFVYIKKTTGEMDCIEIENLKSNKTYLTCFDDVYNKLKNSLNIQKREPISYEKIVNKISNNHLKINQLEPLYLRKSQAEIQRENKLKK